MSALSKLTRECLLNFFKLGQKGILNDVPFIVDILKKYCVT